MWTSDLFYVVSPPQLPKHHAFFDFPAGVNLSPYSESSDNDSRSVSPMPADPVSPASPRSIFKRYWEGSKSCNQEDGLSPKFRNLHLPLVDSTQNSSSSHPALNHEETKSSDEDAADKAPDNKLLGGADHVSVTDRLPPVSPPPRRQILPAPPTSPFTPKPACTKPCCRPWSSTSALISKPKGSCLRPSRYSFSGSNSASLALADVEGGSSSSTGLKKEVSFFSQVSVFEFTVPQEKRADGWSKYFV
ncbi:hypothetical protein HJC23_007238 [Cyclotella cryptica]|uniref:Uncharacterized protein n=1 Tax=Cyclotella cryptica TaxID=29204 RepID=A0ABD3PZK8_9STRA|eukprot:CCRYP_010015-RA/>CCRYP_010015-RA protein AED:0.53 eAED:0.57 QI:0/-1/0/1/-1/1/1/0/246